MDRRSLLKLAGAVAGSMPWIAAADGQARQGTPAPAFPPADGRSVWLVGDDGARDPVETAGRLAALAHSGNVADSYGKGGAVAALEAAFAALLGKEACAFFPTGTLANTVALRVLCGEDGRALCQHESHLYRDESDAAQRLAGLNLVPLAPDRAVPTAAEWTAAYDVAEKGPYPVKVGAISIESPVRRADGAMLSLAEVRAVASLARAHGSRLHLDGARLLLAPADVDIRAYAAPFDTVYVSLYKYLGAPFGAVLAGSAELIAKAVEYRHIHGGLLAQAWMPAALALDTLPGFRATMTEAHRTAYALMAALFSTGRVRRRAMANPSNIYLLEMDKAFADAVFERGRRAGVRIGRWSNGAIPLYVNRTILRRPMEEYAALFGA
jgi:threonine aldolase